MRRLALLIGLVVATGCVTPSIPIPPPDPAKMSFSLSPGPESTASFAYQADANYSEAVVFVFNRDRGVGIIETAAIDGSVGPTAPLEAALNEQIVVTFQRDDQTVSTCVRLREGSPSATDYCGP